MKAKNIIIGLLVLFMNSCGTDIPKEKVLKVSNVSISGNAKEYIKVVDGEYKMKNVNNSKIIISLRIELQKKVSINNPQIPSITLSTIDEFGVVVGNSYGFSLLSLGDYSKIKDLLKGKVGESVIISFESILAGEDTRKQIMEQAVSFEITNANITADKETYSSTTSSNDNNWDEVLDSYEQYVNDYIELYKKAMNGDSSAITEYANMLKNAEDLQKSLQTAKSNSSLSSSQLKRMSKIQSKMLNVMR